MKHTVLFVVFAIIFAAAGICRAEEQPSIELQTPPGLAAQTCKAPVWTNLTVVWKGVKDKRNSAEVGLQTQKGKEPIPVVANPPLDQTFDSALKDVLGACGMKFATKESDDALNLSVEIRDFYAGVEKKLFTGKSRASSNIAFLAQRGIRSSSVTVGYEMESKKIRSGDIKQLKKTLEELFTETLKQIPETQEMRELLK